MATVHDIEDKYWMMHECGGKLEEIGKVPCGWTFIPLYKCKNCGREFDSTDYEQIAGYWELRKLNRKEEEKKLTETQ